VLPSKQQEGHDMRLMLALGALALLGACQLVPARPAPPPPMPDPLPEVRPQPGVPPAPVRPGPAAPAPSDDTCQAAQLQHLVGQPLPNPLPVSGHVRVLPHGVSVTMEYEAGRTSIWLGPDNRVQSVTCG